MKKIVKKLIIPIIIVVLFAAAYFFIYPIFKLNNAVNNIFQNFENGLTNLNIEYQKEALDSTIFGAKKAYSYTADEKVLKLYVFPLNSSQYKEGEKNGYIASKDNEDIQLYGIFYNNCVLLIESDYPNNEQILTLFNSLSSDYLHSL